jgi:hypothetical protein
MPENLTDAAKIEELGTTLYDRAREVREIADLIDEAIRLAGDKLAKVHLAESSGMASRLAYMLSRDSARLNPNAAADSMERNGEPLEVADCSPGLKYAQFKDVDGLTGMIEDGSNGTLWMGMSHRKLHLSRQQVAALLPHLKRFVETGRL